MSAQHCPTRYYSKANAGKDLRTNGMNQCKFSKWVNSTSAATLLDVRKPRTNHAHGRFIQLMQLGTCRFTHW
jgi:hypothetical protein